VVSLRPRPATHSSSGIVCHLDVAGAVGGHGASRQLPRQFTVQEQPVSGEGLGLGADRHHVPRPVVGVCLRRARCVCDKEVVPICMLEGLFSCGITAGIAVCHAHQQEGPALSTTSQMLWQLGASERSVHVPIRDILIAGCSRPVTLSWLQVLQLKKPVPVWDLHN